MEHSLRSAGIGAVPILKDRLKPHIFFSLMAISLSPMVRPLVARFRRLYQVLSIAREPRGSSELHQTVELA